MQNNRHFPQTENSLNNWDAPVRHAPGRYRDYREKYALTTGEVTARYCENITNPTVQPDGKPLFVFIPLFLLSSCPLCCCLYYPLR